MSPNAARDSSESRPGYRAVPLQARLETATAGLEPPFAVVDLDAFDANAADLLARARGKPVRLASKSVRVPGADRPRAGRRADRASWRSRCPRRCGSPATTTTSSSPTRPSTARALRELASGPARERVTVMVDCREHLDLIEAATAGRRARLHRRRRRLVAAGRAGADRRQALAAAHARAGRGAGARDRRPAGARARRADDVRGADRGRRRPARQPAARRSPCAPCSARRRASWRRGAPPWWRRCPPLRFVNGGGTGSVAAHRGGGGRDRGRRRVGPVRPHAVRRLQQLHPRPAAFFALPVVRRPGRRVATVLGGGYPASGPAGRDRLPRPAFPPGLRLDRQEGAGEVQTPVPGSRTCRSARASGSATPRPASCASGSTSST